MENVSPIITAQNLNLWYGDFKALKDISLDMGEREITALIGPSGCVTSFLLRVTSQAPDGGSRTFSGLAPKNYFIITSKKDKGPRIFFNF